MFTAAVQSQMQIARAFSNDMMHSHIGFTGPMSPS